MRQQYIENIPLPRIQAPSGDIDASIYKTFGFNAEEVGYIRKAVIQKKRDILQGETACDGVISF